MSGTATPANGTAASLPAFPQTMGHPRPLWMLFMTEFWERFAFYGIRWALVLYIVAQFYGGSGTGETPANQLYGAYLALVYAAAIFGGYVADRVIGYQRSILLGATIMGVHAVEMIHEVGVAISDGLTVPELGEIIHAHPTVSEMVMDAAQQAVGVAPYLS